MFSITQFQRKMKSWEWPPRPDLVRKYRFYVFMSLCGSVLLTFVSKRKSERASAEARWIRSNGFKMREICTDLIDLIAQSNPKLVRDVLTRNCNKAHEVYNLNRMKILSVPSSSDDSESIKAESLVEASLNADNATRLDRNATSTERRVVCVSKLIAARLLAAEMERETDPDNLEELVDMSAQLCPLMIETYVPYQTYLPRFLLRLLYQCRDENDFALRDVMSRAVSRARKLIWRSRQQRATIAFQFGSRVLGWQIPYFCLSILLSLACGLCASSHLRYYSSIASLAQKVFDTSGPRGGMRSFLGKASDLITAMILMKVMELTLQLIRNRVNESGQSRLLLRLKRELFAAVLRQDIQWFENKGVGRSGGTSHRASEAKRLTDTVDTIVPRLLNVCRRINQSRNSLIHTYIRQENITLTLSLEQSRKHLHNTTHSNAQKTQVPTNTIESLTRVLSSTWILYRTSPKMLLLLCVALPAKTCLEAFLEHTENAVERSVIVQESSTHNRRILRETWSRVLSSRKMRTIRHLAREPELLDMYERALRSEMRRQDRAGLVWRLFDPLRALGDHVVEVLCLFYGSVLISTGSMQPAELSMVLSMADSTFDQIRWLQSMFSVLGSDVMEPVAQILSLLSRKPQIGLDTNITNTIQNLSSWSIDFRDVTFAYASRPSVNVLSKFRMIVQEGRTTGLIGPSGAGKSTVFNLIHRMYDPSSGTIELGGHDIRHFNPLWLRRKIAIVTQDPVLFNCSIKENLLIAASSSKMTIDDSTIKDAMRAANCYDMVFTSGRFPETWHTVVGESASRLSGGEKQRLAIARALLRFPRIILLDEATSALDERSQREVQDAMRVLTKNRTVLVIAHRLSTVRDASKIVCLVNGSNACVGTHEELLKNGNNVYARNIALIEESSSSSSRHSGDGVKPSSEYLSF